MQYGATVPLQGHYPNSEMALTASESANKFSPTDVFKTYQANADTKLDFEGANTTAVMQLLQQHGMSDVDVLLWNMGIWGPKFGSICDRDTGIFLQRHTLSFYNVPSAEEEKACTEQQYRKVMSVGRKVVGEKGIAFWKGTTAFHTYEEHLYNAKRKDWPTVDSLARSQMRKAKQGWHIVDYRQMTAIFRNLSHIPFKSSQFYQKVYWDAVHFQPWVYEELNIVFLSLLKAYMDLQSNHQ